MGITVTTRKDPIIPTVEAIESMQRNIDYWGARAERAEDARERLRDALDAIAELPEARLDEASLIAKRALSDPRNDRYPDPLTTHPTGH